MLDDLNILTYPLLDLSYNVSYIITYLLLETAAVVILALPSDSRLSLFLASGRRCYWYYNERH